MFVILWGWRGREVFQFSEEFHCPECQSEQRCRVIRVATYFTLFFIPLFETQYHGSYVRCDRCHSQYKPAILDYRLPTPEERAIRAIRGDLVDGTPLQEARSKLVNEGIPTADADKMIATAAGRRLVVCEVCDLTFVRGVPRCSECGERL